MKGEKRRTGLISIDGILSLSKDLTLIFSSKGKIILESRKKTLLPLVESLTLIKKCDNLIIYDKTIGLAAAKLHSIINPKVIYCNMISKEAYDFLKSNNIEFHYNKVVEVILTRERKTSPEELLAREMDAEELYEHFKEEYNIE